MSETQQPALTALALELASGPCACDLRTPSGMVGFCPGTRKTRMYRTPGPSVTCTRCRTRQALEADGIEYEKADNVRPDAKNRTETTQ